jgi:hypothetical protein
MRNRTLFAGIACLLLIMTAWAQQAGGASYSDSPVFPSGVKGERIRSAITILNGGNAELIQRFLTTECTEKFRSMVPVDEQVTFFLGFLAQTGMPRILRRMKLARLPFSSPMRLEKKWVKALAQLQAKPMAMGMRNQYTTPLLKT